MAPVQVDLFGTVSSFAIYCFERVTPAGSSTLVLRDYWQIFSWLAESL